MNNNNNNNNNIIIVRIIIIITIIITIIKKYVLTIVITGLSELHLVFVGSTDLTFSAVTETSSNSFLVFPLVSNNTKILNCSQTSNKIKVKPPYEPTNHETFSDYYIIFIQIKIIIVDKILIMLWFCLCLLSLHDS